MPHPDPATADLIAAATAVRENAHAPYSRFKVGAAIRTTDGRIFTGCNVENVAYPEGTCAEAGAIAAMCAAGARDVAAVAVIADSPQPVSPCGGCRQKLAEFSAGDVAVTLPEASPAAKALSAAAPGGRPARTAAMVARASTA